jgi:hypothetical protein
MPKQIIIDDEIAPPLTEWASTPTSPVSKDAVRPPVTRVLHLDEEIEQLLLENARNTLAIGALLETKMQDMNRAVASLADSQGQSNQRTEGVVQKIEETYQKSRDTFHALGRIDGALKEAQKSLDSVLSEDRRKVENIVQSAGDRIQKAADANLSAASNLSLQAEGLRSTSIALQTTFTQKLHDADQGAINRHVALHASVQQEVKSLREHITAESNQTKTTSRQEAKSLRDHITAESNQTKTTSRQEAKSLRDHITTESNQVITATRYEAKSLYDKLPKAINGPIQDEIKELKAQTDKLQGQVFQRVDNVESSAQDRFVTLMTHMRYLIWITGFSLFMCLIILIYSFLR